MKIMQDNYISTQGFSNRGEFVRELLEIYKKNTSDIVDIEDFRKDMSRAMYVSRMLRRYTKKEDLNVFLLLNHLIVMYNCFSHHATTILIEYIDPSLYPQLFGILECFSRLPAELRTEAIDRNIQEIIKKEIN